MVSNKLLYQIRKRLNEILTPTQDIRFDGKSVLVCVDFYQISPVRAKPVFMFNEKGFISMDLWRIFKMTELDLVIR